MNSEGVIQIQHLVEHDLDGNQGPGKPGRERDPKPIRRTHPAAERLCYTQPVAEELGRVWLAALLIGGGTAEREQGALIRIPKGDLEQEGALIVGSPSKNEGAARLPNR